MQCSNSACCPAGLKATFTTAYMHTVIIYIVCLVFAFKVYVPGDLLAGIDQARHALPVILVSDWHE